MTKKTVMYAGLYGLVILGIGYGVGMYTAKKEIVTVEKEMPVYVKRETVTETKIAYVPKEMVIERYIDSSGQEVIRQTMEATDLDANIGKSEFHVKVNGKEQTFVKEDDERYIFDKKITLDQTSKISFDVNVPPIDKTKCWAVGVGYTNGDEIAYLVDFPIGKSNSIDGWVYGSADEKAVGVNWRW